MRCLISLWLVAVTLSAASDRLDEARAQLREGRAGAAIEILQEQVAKDPAALEPGILLVETLLSVSRFDDADEVLDRVVAKNPSELRLQCLLGDVRYREGRVFDADKAYRAVIKADPKNARAIYGISRVFRATCLKKKAYDSRAGNCSASSHSEC